MLIIDISKSFEYSNSRVYISLKITELETFYNNGKCNSTILARLEHELLHRKTRRACRLLENVRRLIAVRATQAVAAANAATKEVTASIEKNCSAADLERDGRKIQTPRATLTKHFPLPNLPLDCERLRIIQAETHRVSQVLAQVFQEPTETPLSVPTKNGTPVRGLTAPHVALLRMVANGTPLRRQDFEEAAATCGLLPDGALENINEWSYDQFGAPLLEDRGKIAVDLDLLQRLQPMTELQSVSA